MKMNASIVSRRRSRVSHSRSGRKAGFTMFEVLLVVVALGLLAALVVPTVDRFFDATGDTAKTHNAQVMNQYMEYTTYVDDNQALAFGGLSGIGESDGITKVPIAGDVPVVGYLFKSKSREIHQRNLVAYIIARVVDQPEPATLPPMNFKDPEKVARSVFPK
jgi:prepilin-type N-terminal cleavage/methylation domain-containing protein